MSYYPNNQPISMNVAQENGDGDESLDIPRSSSHSNTLTVGVTTVGEDSLKGSPVEEHGDGHAHAQHTQPAMYDPLSYQHQQQLHPQMQLPGGVQRSPSPQQQAYGGIAPPSPPSMPATPDRAMVRPRPSGDGSMHRAGGTPQQSMEVPRVSNGSGRSAGTAFAV